MSSGWVADWLKRDQADNRCHSDVVRLLNRDVLPHWQHKPITEITRRDALELIDRVADRGALVMARRLHAHLHRLYEWAVGRGIVEANPMHRLPKVGSETPRDRVLSDRELKLVWDVAVRWAGPWLRLSAIDPYGRQEGEIGGLRV
jgi:integrase